MIAGGVAVCHHGAPRLVGDLDILYLPEQENVRRLISALKPLGYLFPDDYPLRLQSPSAQCKLPTHNAELLGHLAGVETNAAIRDAAVADAAGRSVPVLGLAQLKASKLASARPRDLEDLAALARAGV